MNQYILPEPYKIVQPICPKETLEHSIVNKQLSNNFIENFEIYDIKNQQKEIDKLKQSVNNIGDKLKELEISGNKRQEEIDRLKIIVDTHTKSFNDMENYFESK